MWSSKNNKKEQEITLLDSIIGEGAKIMGNLSTPGSIRIGGDVEGDVQAQGNILIGEKSKITGNLSGARVVVAGEVRGNIHAHNGLEITKSGKVYGDITGDRLIVDEGAIYKGKVNMEVVSREEFEAERSSEDDFTSRIYRTIKNITSSSPQQ